MKLRRERKQLANVVLVGAQWGDEGKGKVVDILAQKADLIVRFQGGNNAGHTLVVEGKKIVLHLIPSGVLHKNKICVIGNGVVVDLDILKQEVDELRARGYEITPENLIISENAHLILPYHKEIDSISEEKKGDQKIGTTKRGIGPTYVDKIAREGIRVGDLRSTKWLEKKLATVLEHKNILLEKIYDQPRVDLDKTLQSLLTHREWMLPFIKNTSVEIHEAMRLGKDVLFEGAQGTSLDVDHGTYPYVTSSNTVAGAACVGAGIGPTDINRVVGVIKAYTTRVGSGPFPTELFDEDGKYLQEKGNEFGATTGRPRRCGWLDAVFLRHAVRVNGITDLVITKLDVLSGMDTIKIGVAYKIDGEQSEKFVSDNRILEKCEPVYEEHPGWKEIPENCTKIEDLPNEAKSFLARVEQLTEAKIMMVSTGPARKDRLVHHEVF